MKQSIELKNDRAALELEASQIVTTAETENREMTDDEQTRFDSLSNQIENLDSQIERAEKAEALKKRTAQRVIPGEPNSKPVSEREAKELNEFRLLNIVRAQSDKNATLTGLEKEMNEEAKREAAENGIQLRGVGVPSLLFKTRTMTRDMNAGTGADGGFFVQTDVSGSVIEALRPKLVLAQAGAQTMGNLTGNLDITKNGGVSVGWKAENAAADETTPVISRIQLTPKRLTGFTDMSQQLIGQTSIGVENMIRNDFFSALASAFEAAAIEGGGSNEPTGILATAGIGDVAGGTNGAAPDWADVIDLEKAVAIDNADMGSLGYLLNPKVRAAFKNTFIDSGSGRQAWGLDNTLNGYDTFVTNNVPSDLTKGSGTDLSAIIFGNFNDLILANWGGLDVVVDPYSQATSGLVRMVVHMFGDVGVRNAESFAAMKDAIAS